MNLSDLHTNAPLPDEDNFNEYGNEYCSWCEKPNPTEICVNNCPEGICADCAQTRSRMCPSCTDSFWMSRVVRRENVELPADEPLPDKDEWGEKCDLCNWEHKPLYRCDGCRAVYMCTDCSMSDTSGQLIVCPNCYENLDDVKDAVFNVFPTEAFEPDEPLPDEDKFKDEYPDVDIIFRRQQDLYDQFNTAEPLPDEDEFDDKWAAYKVLNMLRAHGAYPRWESNPTSGTQGHIYSNITGGDLGEMMWNMDEVYAIEYDRQSRNIIILMQDGVWCIVGNPVVDGGDWKIEDVSHV